MRETFLSLNPMQPYSQLDLLDAARKDRRVLATYHTGERQHMRNN
jgi:hypothetical protein